MSHQIEFIPSGYFDCVINISSLDEMTREQITMYLEHVNRIAMRGTFYTKQHRISRTGENRFIKETEYPIPQNWNVLYQRPHPITRNFFEALYAIRDENI